jgi:hypothetical protein
MDGFSLGRVQQRREKKSLLRELSSTRLSGTFSGEISGDKIRLRHGCHAGLFAALCTLLGPLLSHTYTHYLHIPLEKSQGFIFHTSARSANNPITRARPTAALSYNGYIF